MYQFFCMFLSTVFLGHSVTIHSQLLQLNASVCIRKLKSTVIAQTEKSGQSQTVKITVYYIDIN